MIINNDPGGQKETRRKQRWVVGTLMMIGLSLVGALLIGWRYPNFYKHPQAQLYNWTAAIAALLGNEKLAYFAADRAASLDTWNVEYLDERCWYGSLAGHVEDVIDDCRRLVELEPSSVSAHCSYGVALAFMGNYDGSIKEFQFFIENASHNHHDESFIQEHEHWIQLMRNGEIPFNDQTKRMLLLQ